MKFRILMLLLALVCLSGVCEARGGGPDGVIVFSAQRNGLNTRTHRDWLRPIDRTFHLWCVGADGSGLRQLTRGTGVGDELPSWSPDGRAIIFVREWRQRSSICSLSAGGGRVRTLYSLGQWYVDRLAWSPNGRMVAAAVGAWVGRVYEQSLLVLDVPSRGRASVRLKVPYGVGFAWSPDSRRLYINVDDGRDLMFDVASRKSTRVKSPVWGALWLDNETVFGTVPEKPEHLVDLVRAVDASGNVKWTRKLRPSLTMLNEIPGQEDESWYGSPTPPQPSPPGRELRSPGDCTHLFLQYHTRMANGGSFDTLRVTLPSMKVEHLFQECRWLGMSRDGRYVAVSQWDFVDLGDQGVHVEDARVGPILVMSTMTKKERAITPALWAILSGDWR